MKEFKINDPQPAFIQLLSFFKALADEKRLKIIGLLAQKPQSVENISAALGLSVSTTSHHLSRLSKAGLVSARAESYYSIYSLNTEKLRQMSQQVLQAQNLPELAPEVVEDVFERKVLNAFTDAEGRIKAFPAQQKKFLVLLRHVVKAFEADTHYTEKEVNEILLRFNPDTAQLRRSLVEHHLMSREGGGGLYWRTDETP